VFFSLENPTNLLLMDLTLLCALWIVSSYRTILLEQRMSTQPPYSGQSLPREVTMSVHRAEYEIRWRTGLPDRMWQLKLLPFYRDVTLEASWQFQTTKAIALI